MARPRGGPGRRKRTQSKLGRICTEADLQDRVEVDCGPCGAHPVARRGQESDVVAMDWTCLYKNTFAAIHCVKTSSQAPSTTNGRRARRVCSLRQAYLQVTTSACAEEDRQDKVDEDGGQCGAHPAARRRQERGVITMDWTCLYKQFFAAIHCVETSPQESSTTNGGGAKQANGLRQAYLQDTTSGYVESDQDQEDDEVFGLCRVHLRPAGC